MTAHIKFTHRKSAKRVSLRVDALRRVVTVTAPRRHTDSQLITLLNTHHGWIAENLTREHPILLQDGMSLSLYQFQKLLMHLEVWRFSPGSSSRALARGRGDPGL